MATPSKPRLAFIDHSFHQKSRSGDFLRKILENYFSITDYWDESWQGGPAVEPSIINNHDYVFYFQSLNKITDLRKITIPIIWAPMYDGEKFSYFRWKALSQLPIKIVSFSKKISLACKYFNIPYLELQYYPPILTPNEQPEGNQIFFWQRGGIKFETIKKIINPDQVNRFIYLKLPDPFKNNEDLSQTDIIKYKLEIIDSDFLKPEEYQALVHSTNIFIAPRKKEGIGMSFLEALSCGNLVIAYNESTMNEYIDNNIDGYLFDDTSDSYLDLDKKDKLTTTAQKRYRAGHEKWLQQSKSLYPFIFDSIKCKNQNIASLWLYIILDKLQSLSYKCSYLLKKITHGI